MHEGGHRDGDREMGMGWAGGDEVGTRGWRWGWHRDGAQGNGVGRGRWRRWPGRGHPGGVTLQPPAHPPSPQQRPRALEGPAPPQPGTGAFCPHARAAGTRVQRRWHHGHLWGSHLPPQPLRWVRVWVGAQGGGSQILSCGCDGSAFQRAAPPYTGISGCPASAWPCTYSVPVTSSPSTSKPAPSTAAPSPGWSRWGWGTPGRGGTGTGRG